MASLRYASYLEEEDWDIATLQVVNAHLQRLVSMLPGGGADLTIADLQELAAQQQAAMETQQQALVAKETRLKYLQQQEARHRQLASEQLRLQRMKERVEAQELKLRKLRAVRGQVDQFKDSNGNLNTELEAIRAMFNEKEKELALAVSKVDQLMQQLQEFKEVKTKDVIVQGYKSGENSNLELEKLKNELVHRHKQNEQQHDWLEAKQRLLQQRKDEVSTMDSRILELQQLLKIQCRQQLHNVSNTIEQKTNSVSSVLGIVQHKSGQNIANVEPYIKTAKDVAANDLHSINAIVKQDPKYQTESAHTKFGSIPDDSSKSRTTGIMNEMNNNSKKFVIGQWASASDSNLNGVQPMEYKMPSLISTHFDAQRVRGIAGNQQISPMGQNSGKGITQHQTPLVSFSGENVKVSRTDSKSGLPKWPPELVKDKEQVSRQPQINIFDEERQAGSGQSSPASSEGSGPLAQQRSGVFTHPPTFSAQPFNNATGSPVPERMSHPVKRPGPSPLPQTPQGMAAVKPVMAKVQDDEHPLQTGNGEADCSKFIFNNLLSLGEPRALLTPTTVAAAPATQGLDHTENRIALGIHLNQRPAPTYRYASKTVIANTYMGRLGNVAMGRYQQMNKQIYNIDSICKPGPETWSLNTTQNTSTAGETGAASKNIQSEMSCDKRGESAKMANFGIVGSPYPDIASDKGSYKTNTPKHIRRRHSDSDNEELSKALQHVEKQAQLSINNVTVKTIKNNDMDISVSMNNGNNGEPIASQEMLSPNKSGDKTNDTIDSLPVPANDITDKKTGGIVIRKKPILKGANGHKMLNRVSFDPLALLLDASLEGELELVKRTAKEVNDVSAPNDEGITALHNAICAGHYDIVKFLVEFGADANSPDSDGWTPLHCAASCNNLPMVRFLVEHGACIFAATISDNETAAEKCEEDEDGYDGCSDYLYSVQEKLGISNDGAVYAVFDFLANNADELSFNINHKLTIIRKGDEREKDWWWARTASGAEGYIPRNMLGLYPRVLRRPNLKSPDISEKSQDTSEC